MNARLPLGQETPYPRDYDPSILFGIPRDEGRRALGLREELPFTGVDLWNAHELSWLDAGGKPVVATAELWIPHTSPSIVESKSLKLYLNSLNDTRHADVAAVQRVITTDLQDVVGSQLEVRLALAPAAGAKTSVFSGATCLDDTDVTIEAYDLDPGLLDGSVDPGDEVEETLCSHLLKNNCPVTGQPDWAALYVRYCGPRIDRPALLRYIVSFRNHDAFHEHCVERIFIDIKARCGPRDLTVFARYSRRGGIDINPFRSDFESLTDNVRAWRQ